jgi:RNA polymerase sigma-70 factor (ECF subfamily)
MMRGDAEAETIARAASGDGAAQRALYEAHHAAAFRLAYLLLQDTCDAEEVVQDVFVYLFRNLGRYDAGRGSFWAWLRVALVSRCRNKRRGRRLRVVSLDVLDAAGRPPADAQPSGNPAGVLEGLGTRKVVWEALQRVSTGARNALILRYYEGLSYVEIAAVLGCSPDAARARVSNGKVQLRRLLAGPEGEAICEGGVVRTAKVG